MAGHTGSKMPGLRAGGLQRMASTQILSFRSFIASFDVAFIQAVAPPRRSGLTFVAGAGRSSRPRLIESRLISSIRDWPVNASSRSEQWRWVRLAPAPRRKSIYPGKASRLCRGETPRPPYRLRRRRPFLINIICISGAYFSRPELSHASGFFVIFAE